GAALEAKTDAIGVATFEVSSVVPKRGRSGNCYGNQIALAATADGKSESHCASVAGGGLLVRTDRAIYALGQKMELDVIAAGGGEKKSVTPGETGKIRLHVVDATSGQGVQAAVGVVMVDQALLALRPVRPGAARTYFTLAREAAEPKLALKTTPAGYTLEKLIDESQLDGLKQEAAMVLLAGAQPPWSGAWEVDPWANRKTRNGELQ